MAGDTNEVAHEIEWAVLRADEGAVIAHLIRFPGSDDIVCWTPRNDPSLPERIFLQTWFDVLPEAPDYPRNDVRWPVVSRRMLDSLRAVGSFRHRAIPVFLMDDRLSLDESLDAHGVPRPEATEEGYVILQLLEYTDVLDREHSEIEFDEEGEIETVYNPVFRVPEQGLPPIFRIPEHPVLLFVSAEARAALERDGIKGPVYRPLSRCVL